MTRLFSGLFLSALLLGISPAQGQTATYSPGFVVTIAGDTLRGEMAELPEVVASRQVQFRADAGDEPRILRAGQLDRVVFDSGRTYVGHVLRPADELRPEDLLLLLLVEGDVSLYAFSYEDPISLIDHIRVTQGGQLVYRPDRFAVSTPDGETIPLYERRIQVSEFRASDTRVERQFEDQLRWVFADCPAEVARLPRMRFGQRALVDAVTRYNECIGGTAEVAHTDVTRRRADVFVEFGARLSAGAGAMHQVRTAQSTRSDGATFSFGLLARVRPVLFHRNFSIPIEARIGYSGMFAQETVNPLDVDDFATMRAGLSLGFEQAFPMTSIEPFVGVGVTTSRIFQDDVQQCSLISCWFAPKWESSVYGDVGIAGRPFDALGRMAVGLRFESIGVGHQNPFSRRGNTWEARTISAFTVVLF